MPRSRWRWRRSTPTRSRAASTSRRCRCSTAASPARSPAWRGASGGGALALARARRGAALEHFVLLQAFGRQLRPYGIRLGLEHAGQRLARIEGLYEAGLDYVKLDGAVTRGLAQDTHAADFVRNTVSLLHALSLQVMAEGVIEAADAEALWACGIDAITGPLVGPRQAG